MLVANGYVHISVIYTLVYICIYKAGFKKRKVIRNFCEIAIHFGKVIRNCESCIHKMCLKRRNICDEDLKSDSQIT